MASQRLGTSQAKKDNFTERGRWVGLLVELNFVPFLDALMLVNALEMLIVVGAV